MLGYKTVFQTLGPRQGHPPELTGQAWKVFTIVSQEAHSSFIPHIWPF